MKLRLRVSPLDAEPFVFDTDDSSLTIGRSTKADLPIPSDQFLSRRHAKLFRDDDTWFIEDLGSRNTTLLNGRAVTEPRELRIGDVIKMSDCVVVVDDLLPDSGSYSDLLSSSSDSGAVYRPARELIAESDSKEQISSGERTTLRRYAERLRLLNEVHRSLANPVSKTELLDLILDRAFAHLEPEEAVLLLRASGGRFERAAARRLPGIEGDYFHSTHLVEEVAHKGLAALVLDAEADERFEKADSLLDAGIRSLVAAPLQHRDGILGMIALATRASKRKFTEDDMEFLVSLAAIAALHLRNLELLHESARRQQVERELLIAREIQVALFPESLPKLPGYDMYAKNEPSRTVSGDLYRIQERGGDECLIMIADVSGKGIAASLLTASLEALSAGPIEMGRSPEEICVRLARRLHERTRAERFATAFVAALHVPSGRVRFANAGHNPALFLRKSGDVEELFATGIPLGLLPAFEYDAGEITLERGDSLVFYTDGVTEVTNDAGDEYGSDRLRELCSIHCNDSPVDLTAAIEQDCRNFAGDTPYADDRTIVVLRRS